MSSDRDKMEEYYEEKILPIYKNLLKECEKALNEIPNTQLKNCKSKDSYTIASNINKLLSIK